MVSQQKSILKTSYSNIKPYTTRDGSLIRELMHPEVHGNTKQSLAEATIPVGTGTVLHRHDSSEEIYHITAGRGRMTLGEHTFEVVVGDTICIPPGTDHRIENTGRTTLKLFCCCAPPYSHVDTELLK
ncbi:MAG: cupin domain-containing protein [Syntrophobacterales bacterium]|jgi:mannose-6-phosphate isomerase-like protein (cupin superfamily)